MDLLTSYNRMELSPLLGRDTVQISCVPSLLVSVIYAIPKEKVKVCFIALRLIVQQALTL